MGAGGNLGMTGIQIAKNVIGATVIAAAGSEGRAQIGRALGADHAVNYDRHDLTDEVMRITGGKGVDAILVDKPQIAALLEHEFGAAPLSVVWHAIEHQTYAAVAEELSGLGRLSGSSGM